MDESKKKSKKIGYVLGLVAFIALAAGVTYAWLTWRSNNIIIAGTSECFDVVYYRKDLGTAENPAKIRFMESYVGAQYAEVGLSLDPRCASVAGTGKLYLTTNVSTDSAILTGGLYYTLVKVQNEQEEFIQEGPITATGDLLLTDDVVVNTQTSGIKYRVYVWINGPITTSQSYVGASYSGEIRAEVVSSESTETAATYITNLYLNNKDNDTVENNGIDYQTASSVSLMNDRLGGTTESLDGGNIRYYGADPDNYVWLGETYTSDYTIEGNVTADGYASVEECIEDGNSELYCTEDVVRHANDRKLYRIIGVFDGKLKLIAEDSIGKYSWDTSSSTASNENNGYGINEWTQADLMKLLNPGFESLAVNNSLYWNKSANGTCYAGHNNNTVDCDFSNIGLSTTARNMISSATWYLGAFNNSDVYSDELYDTERGTEHVVVGTTCSTTNNWCTDTVERKYTWNGKVGLVYPSDLGYAADFNECSYTIGNYYKLDCASNNWIRNGEYYWSLSSLADGPNDVWYVYFDGFLGRSYAGGGWFAVRPVFYLKSVTVIESGSGDREDPYILR